MTMRREFALALLRGIGIIWPVLSALTAVIVGAGLFVGSVEGWGLWRGVYFAFVTALTIGYGDLVPTHRLTQAVAVLTGFTGILVTALLAGVAVRAFQVSASSERKD
jgi:hypothetical protein